MIEHAAEKSRLPALSVRLERRDARRNMARFYMLEIEPDLFGGLVLVRRWGRIGTFGRCKRVRCPDWAAAEAEARRIEGIKARRGYCPAERPPAERACGLPEI